MNACGKGCIEPVGAQKGRPNSQRSTQSSMRFFAQQSDCRWLVSNQALINPESVCTFRRQQTAAAYSAPRRPHAFPLSGYPTLRVVPIPGRVSFTPGAATFLEHHHEYTQRSGGPKSSRHLVVTGTAKLRRPVSHDLRLIAVNPNPNLNLNPNINLNLNPNFVQSFPTTADVVHHWDHQQEKRWDVYASHFRRPPTKLDGDVHAMRIVKAQGLTSTERRTFEKRGSEKPPQTAAVARRALVQTQKGAVQLVRLSTPQVHLSSRPDSRYNKATLFAALHNGPDHNPNYRIPILPMMLSESVAQQPILPNCWK